MQTAEWRCWDGSAFSLQYRNPYTNTVDPVQQIPHRAIFPKGPGNHNVNWLGNAVWSHTLGKFVLVASLKRFPSPWPSGELVDGIVYYTSSDFIHFSEPHLLIEWLAHERHNESLPFGAMVGSSDSPRAAIFESDPAVSGRNFDKIGDRPYLFYQCSDGKFSSALCYLQGPAWLPPCVIL